MLSPCSTRVYPRFGAEVRVAAKFARVLLVHFNDSRSAPGRKTMPSRA